MTGPTEEASVSMACWAPAMSPAPSFARAKLAPGGSDARFETGTPVPYGIAIAAAAILVIFLPHFR